MMKNYLLDLLHLCSDEQFGQDAIEWAIVSDFVRLTYDKEGDLRLIMGEPGKPDTGRYDEIVEAYRRVVSQNREALIECYQPILEEILRPVPLSMRTSAKKEIVKNLTPRLAPFNVK